MKMRRSISGALGALAMFAAILVAPSPAAAAPVGPLCVPETSANGALRDGMYGDQPVTYYKITVTFNGCRVSVRAFMHCNNWPFGTVWDYGSTVTAVGATSEAMCIRGKAIWSKGYQYYSGGWQNVNM